MDPSILNYELTETSNTYTCTTGESGGYRGSGGWQKVAKITNQIYTNSTSEGTYLRAVTPFPQISNFFIKFRSSTDTSSPSGWSKQISFEVTAVTAVTASSSYEILVNSTNLGTAQTSTSAGDMVINSTISHNFKSETTVPSVLILSKSQLASQFSMTPVTKQ